MQPNSELLAILDDLIGFPTVSSQPNKPLIEYIAAYCRDAASLVHQLDAPFQEKASLLLRFGPDAPGGILLSGHSDVVPADGAGWTSDPFVLTLRDDRVYGRGVADMKGFLAAVMATARNHVRTGPPLQKPVYLAITYDEEVGCLAAPPLIESFQSRIAPVDAVIVGEPSLMRPVLANKGITEYVTDFHGASGHSSKPHRGINAIEIAHHYLATVLALAEGFRTAEKYENRCDPPYTTVQIGTIRGGSATNIIPEHCRISCDLRSFHSEDRLRFESAIEDTRRSLLQAYQLPDDAIITTKTCDVPPLEPDPDSVAMRLAAELTTVDTPDWVPYATEAGQYQQAGYPTVILGPGSIEQAHQDDEWISLEQLTLAQGLIEDIFTRQSRIS